MPAYPLTIPFFKLLAGYQRTSIKGTVVTTSVDAGPPIIRRRTTAGIKNVSGVIAKMTASQIVTLDDWFENTIMHGTLSFTAEDPLDAVTKNFRLLEYTITPISGEYFRVNGKLEIWP